MRCAGGRKFGELGLVTDSTNRSIACLDAPGFHEGSTAGAEQQSAGASAAHFLHESVFFVAQPDSEIASSAATIKLHRCERTALQLKNGSRIVGLVK
jgi:hypothetical protein